MEQRAFATGSIFTGLRHIVQREGVAALWRGNTVTCLHRFPFTGLNFWVVESCRRWDPELCSRSLAGQLMPGALAGSTAVCLCYPLEVLRTRRMVQRGSGERWWLLRGFMGLLQREGFAGIFRGMPMAILATVPSVSISFAVYEPTKDLLSSSFGGVRCCEPAPWYAVFIAGGVAGVAGSTLTFPLDVLRRRMQVMGICPTLPQRNCLREFKHLARTEGVRGFFRGMTPEFVKVFPNVAITFLTFEWLHKQMIGTG